MVKNRGALGRTARECHPRDLQRLVVQAALPYRRSQGGLQPFDKGAKCGGHASIVVTTSSDEDVQTGHIQHAVCVVKLLDRWGGRCSITPPIFSGFKFLATNDPSSLVEGTTSRDSFSVQLKTLYRQPSALPSKPSGE
ncbi:hypothetical protein FQR65_LT17846 [Abscondita terminalis]|nr:hypothetical protein FQR65_LT17846 [Abscondita terminalis]